MNTWTKIKCSTCSWRSHTAEREPTQRFFVFTIPTIAVYMSHRSRTTPLAIHFLRLDYCEMEQISSRGAYLPARIYYLVLKKRATHSSHRSFKIRPPLLCTALDSSWWSKVENKFGWIVCYQVLHDSLKNFEWKVENTDLRRLQDICRSVFLNTTDLEAYEVHGPHLGDSSWFAH